MDNGTNADEGESARADTPPAAPGVIAHPGETCWRIDRADRLALLIDAAAYFETLRAALINARRQVLIVAWDISGTVPLLDPQADPPDDGWPTVLAPLLRALTEARPDLTVSVLLWDFPMLYASKRELLPEWRETWNPHPRMRLRLDGSGPVEGAHHEKIVVIDDRLVFFGGLDLAPARWDTRAHEANDPRRRLPGSGEPYPPFHDMQVMMEGPVATTLGAMVRERWARVTEEPPQPAPPGDLPSPWPESEADRLAVARAEAMPVALARTAPPIDDAPGIDEIATLIHANIAAARRWIYLEDQYLTGRMVAEALADRLREPDGPEVVAVISCVSAGWLETATMGVGRERLLSHLRAADRHGRLRVLSPTLGARDSAPIKVHTKLLIVDDRALCHGSANLNNRSMGLDTELDWHIEATEGWPGDGQIQGDPETVRHLTDTVLCEMLGEHLGVGPEPVRETLRETGSLCAVLDRYDGHPERALSPVTGGDAPDDLLSMLPNPVPGDFERPVSVEDLGTDLSHSARGDARPVAAAVPSRSRSLGPAVAAGVALVALVGVWRVVPVDAALTPETLTAWVETARQTPLAPALAVVAVALGSLLLAPILLLVTAVALVLGPGPGFLCSLAGALASAVAGFALGRALGRRPAHHLARRWPRAARVLDALQDHGFKTVVIARVLPALVYGLVSVACGATGIRWRPYLWGTLIGMAPVIAAASLFGEGLGQVLRAGSLAQAVPVAAGLLGAVVLARLVWARLIARRDRDRAPEAEAP
ncbi:VTT domain-containing protein [Roseospira visakhapatnamensis]|uniref:Putative membrane protein YdjX (TVP38/TMEM64 family)/phosphatidylserine/phosphatidylglycerophosphate/ca rdiolipin synthase-like enzyme n=1 Tax=Roseospira visakhapatnamensis TaxID=390880 RepID=A0A7W6WA63_9PROT|nr:VTT domain-containing protein [Roseospira visakhapatnamensis]MBB4266151.1 putative membrane protein YdjX (TVP38/TMEM64 family)/phosphatidylserine/phosphatidylglycerophosphate/cardiolipin synthase-like enzyme [Roseospira visakhapatnamensis]